MEPTKGLLNSSTITSALLLLLTNAANWIVQNITQIQEVLLQLFPMWLDPFVPPIAQGIVIALNLYLTGKVIAGRAQVGDIHGLYTKEK